jgi:nitrite reductase/ring-hydroxylating ferredoxin subunit
MSGARIKVDVPVPDAPNQARAVTLPRGPNDTPRQAILVRDAQGELHAYLNVCMHMAIPIDAFTGDFLSPEGTHLLCRTHGATYRLDDGMCVHGPCVGRALVRLELVREPDALYLVDVF